MTSIRDMFVANDSLWLGGFKPFPQKRSPAWGPYFATSRDLRTGEVLMHVECDNPGHHHRCYSNKATDRYILAGRRGTEFIDLNTGEVREHSWARGVCKYGIMPCNGLMYAPPHSCACYVGARVSGFTALAPLRLPKESAPRPDERAHVERGGAYGRDASREEAADTSACWPTYRGDCSRSGSTGAHVPTNLACKWKRRIGETPSSPVVAGGLLLVTDVETHAVHALDAASGEPIWTYTAGGRIDSPPTVACNRAVFGCADGSVYCLTTSDGKLVWRFIPDQTGRRIVAQGQLESVRPTHGSVLIQDNIVSFAAGRSSYLDGGISLYRLNLATGEVLTKTPVYSPDPETGKQPPQSAPYSIPGVRSDILVGDGDRIYLREMTFDNAGKKCIEGKSHLFTLTDFLDDSWPHRSYWIFGREISIACGCSGRRRGLIYGRLLVFNHSTVFGYGRSNVHWSNQLQDGPYRVFAIGREGKDENWERHVGIHARAMVLTDNALFAAGPVVQQEPGPGAPDRTEKAELIALAPGDGALIGRVSIDTPPIFDGMAATPGHLYLTLEDGNVACLSANAR